jgi:hypothetical protein
VIYQPYLHREKGKSVYGKAVNLGPKDMSVPDVWIAYHRETKEETHTLRWMLGEYHDSRKFKSLSPRTQRDYESYRRILSGYKMNSGKPFGIAPLDNIRRTAIQQLVDRYPSPTSINRMIQYLRAVWNWSLNRLENIPPNPCTGVELNVETHRKRYVTPDEYNAVHPLTRGWVYWAMEIAYLCRARRSEIITMPVSSITTEGLDWERTKGSEGEITEWTPRLRAAIDGALKHSYGDARPIGNMPILLNNRGERITASAWNSALQRLRPKMVELGIEPFTLHDLKAKGYSEQDDQFAGHKSPKMHDTYNRKKRIVRPAE